MNRYAKRSNFGHPIRTPLLREHFVYRAFADAGDLLYIGCTQNLENRLKEHRSSRAPWLPLVVHYRLQGPYNYETAREFEYEAIETERSLFNYSSERREIDRIKQTLTKQLIAHFMAGGMEFFAAAHEAVDVSAELIPVEGRSALRIDDLTVPTYRRIAQDYIAGIGGAS